MREHHQWERNHIFNVFLHISLARLRTCASASAGVGKSHGSTRPVAIRPRLRNIFFFFHGKKHVCVHPLAVRACFLSAAASASAFSRPAHPLLSRPSAVRISFCVQDAKIINSVWPRLSIAAGIRGGRRGAVPLVWIMLMLMRIVLF